MMVSPAQLSVLRMIPVARRVAKQARGELAVFRLLNSHRGWATHHTPIDDVDWALERLDNEHPRLPVGLVGHSLGGRAALLAGDRRQVQSVVALNPYLLPQDRHRLGATPTLVVHGEEDRIARPSMAYAYVEQAPPSAHISLVRVPRGRHAMLRRARTFHALAAEFTATSLLDPTAD